MGRVVTGRVRRPAVPASAAAARPRSSPVPRPRPGGRAPAAAPRRSPAARRRGSSGSSSGRGTAGQLPASATIRARHRSTSSISGATRPVRPPRRPRAPRCRRLAHGVSSFRDPGRDVLLAGRGEKADAGTDRGRSATTTTQADPGRAAKPSIRRPPTRPEGVLPPFDDRSAPSPAKGVCRLTGAGGSRPGSSCSPDGTRSRCPTAGSGTRAP